MSQIPAHLRQAIAYNIRRLRQRNYPGRGGAKRCAAEFGVAPQQWSPWERGRRTPGEEHLERIARFFGVAVEEMFRGQPDPFVPVVPVAREADLVTAGFQMEEVPSAEPQSESPGIVDFHRALTRLVNLTNKVDISVSVPFLNSLSDIFEASGER